MSQTQKNGSHCEQWLNIAKIDYTKKSGSGLGNGATRRKMGQTFENDLHLEKWVTLENMVTVKKMGPTWISLTKIGLTWKNRTHLEK